MTSEGNGLLLILDGRVWLEYIHLLFLAFLSDVFVTGNGLLLREEVSGSDWGVGFGAVEVCEGLLVYFGS